MTPDSSLLQGKPGPWNYNPEEVRAVLEKLCASSGHTPQL